MSTSHSLSHDKSEAYLEGYSIGLRPDGEIDENPYARGPGSLRSYLRSPNRKKSHEWVQGWIDGSERFIAERESSVQS